MRSLGIPFIRWIQLVFSSNDFSLFSFIQIILSPLISFNMTTFNYPMVDTINIHITHILNVYMLPALCSLGTTNDLQRCIFKCIWWKLTSTKLVSFWVRLTIYILQYIRMNKFLRYALKWKKKQSFAIWSCFSLDELIGLQIFALLFFLPNSTLLSWVYLYTVPPKLITINSIG